MKKRVLIAGFTTRHVARSASAAGYTVYSVDHFCDRDLSAYVKDCSRFEDLASLPGAIVGDGRMSSLRHVRPHVRGGIT